MLTKYIIGGAKVLLLQFVKMTGMIIPLPSWFNVAFNYFLTGIRQAADMLKWMIPNEAIYDSIIGIAVTLLGIWLVSKIFGFCIRLYDLLLV